MIRLAASEFLRLRSRRMVRVLVLLALIGIAVGVGIGAARSHPRFADIKSTVEGTAFLLIVFGLVVGASSIGADLHLGSMTTLLTWETRRLRVVLVRLSVVVATVFAIVLVLQVLLAGAIAVAAWARASNAGPPGWLGQLVGEVLRISVLAAAMAAVGMAIATIGRNSAAALGVVFVYLALVENLLRGLVPNLTRLTLSVNTVVFAAGKSLDAGGSTPITVTWASAVIGTYVVVITFVAAFTFRVRDVN